MEKTEYFGFLAGGTLAVYGGIYDAGGNRTSRKPLPRQTISVSPSGKFLVQSSANKLGFTLIDRTTGEAVRNRWQQARDSRVVRLSGMAKSLRQVRIAIFSPDEHNLFVLKWNSIAVYPLQGGIYKTIKPAKYTSFSHMTLSPDGKTLVAHQGDGMVIVCDAPQLKQLRRYFSASGGFYNRLTFSNNQTVYELPRFRRSRRVPFWNIEEQGRKLTWTVKCGGNVEDLQVSEDGTSVTARTSNVRAPATGYGFVDLRDPQAHYQHLDPKGPRAVAWRDRKSSKLPQRDDKKLTAGATRDYRVVIRGDGWNARTIPHARYIRDIEVSTDQRLVLSASEDATVCLWDAMTGELRLRLSFGSPARCVSLSKDGRTLACGLQDGTIKVYRTEPLKPK